MLSESRINIAAVLFFILFFIVGVFTFRDYGISFDEGFQRTLIGEVNYNYIKTGDASVLLKEFERYYGPAYEVVLYASEKLFDVTDSRSIFLLRHFISFLTFFIATICFYLLSLKIFKKKQFALLSCVFLVLSPRIYAEGFYNSKDLSMLCFTIIACYTMYLCIERQTILMAIIHAATCGFVIDIRITGILIPFVTIYFFLIQKQKRIVFILFFIVYLLFFIIIFWPYLWQNPIHNFIEAFNSMSKFPWNGNVLYFGEYTLAKNLPWHYLLVWISISTPMLYLFSFLIGLFFIIKNTFSNFLNTIQIQPILCLAILPLIIILILKSVVYDGWRHVFFIYPFVVLVAVYGLIELKKRFAISYQKNSLKIVIASSLAYILLFMIINHPFNNVYFNAFAGKKNHDNFEMDYWGLSYKKGLEYILQQDSSSVIYVNDDIGLAELSLNMIEKEDRKRIIFTRNINQANYFLGNYRWHLQPYTVGNFYYEINAYNEKILEVRKLK